jgi:Kef-type K+ transport system membrane component KefB
LIVIAVVLLAPIVFERAFRLPGMVGLLIGGMLIGPNVLDWVVDQEAVDDIGQLGLLFLMFLAGVELDLDDFQRHRADAIRFGALTFAIPLGLGIVVGSLGFEYGVAAAVLYGSLWASHTLVAYPIVRQHGVASTRPVSMAVGGTVITDTSALFLLGAVVGAYEGDGSPVTIVALLFGGLAGLLAFAIIVLPRVVGWFFRGYGQDRLLRYLAVFVALLAAALVAHSVGLEAIIGAFFAGLALNRLVPNRSPLMERLEFAGSSLLIPFFLVSTGMRLDPESLTDPKTIGLAVASLLVVIVGKLLAAWIAGRSIGATRPEIGVVFSLSVAQAAATLATVVVGLEAGIFDDRLFNAALVVVLVTLVIAPLGAARFAPDVRVEGGERRRLGEVVLVPVTDETTAARARLGARLASADAGIVVLLAVTDEGAPSTTADARARLAAAAQEVTRLGAEPELLHRVDDSLTEAVLRTAVERDASAIVGGIGATVRGLERLLGPSRDDLVALSRAPVLAVAPGAEEPSRVVLALEDDDLRPGRGNELPIAVETARKLTRALDSSLVVLAPELGASRPIVVELERAPVEAYTGARTAAVSATARAGDVVVVPARVARGGVGATARELARAAAKPTVVVAAAPQDVVGSWEAPAVRALAGVR